MLRCSLQFRLRLSNLTIWDENIVFSSKFSSLTFHRPPGSSSVQSVVSSWWEIKYWLHRHTQRHLLKAFSPSYQITTSDYLSFPVNTQIGKRVLFFHFYSLRRLLLPWSMKQKNTDRPFGCDGFAHNFHNRHSQVRHLLVPSVQGRLNIVTTQSCRSYHGLRLVEARSFLIEMSEIV